METSTTTEPDEPPATSIAVHGSKACPVCHTLFTKPGRLATGVDCAIGYSDARVLDHLTTHTPRELAFAYLVADARLHMARAAVHAAKSSADRYDRHLTNLADQARPQLAP